MSKASIPKVKRRCIFCQKAASRGHFCTACGAVVPEMGKSLALESAIRGTRAAIEDPHTDPRERARHQRLLAELKALTTDTVRATVDAARKPATVAVTKSRRAAGAPGPESLAAGVLRDFQEMTLSADPRERETARAVLASGRLSGGAR